MRPPVRFKQLLKVRSILIALTQTPCLIITCCEVWAALTLNVRIAILTGVVTKDVYPIQVHGLEGNEIIFMWHHMSYDASGNGSQHFDLVSKVGS